MCSSTKITTMHFVPWVKVMVEKRREDIFARPYSVLMVSIQLRCNCQEIL
jgi:hypothetical protein